MSKHTEGPWEIDEGEISGTFVVFQDGSQDAIATVWENYSEKENDANARLIAAAPDLLEALQAAYQALMNETSVGVRSAEKRRAELALAKARGEEE